MCEHPEVEFIGYQERMNGKPIPLYNCLICNTTITLPRSGKHRKLRNPAASAAAPGKKK